MLVFSAFTPHTPILLDDIGGEKTDKLSNTLTAMKKLEAELYAAQPETIIIIGGHSNIAVESFRLPYAEIFRTSFKEVGNYSLHKDFKPDLPLTQLIRERTMGKLAVNLFPEKLLDYGLCAPLHLLTSKIQGVKIIPVHHSGLSLAEHQEFGGMLREIIEETPSRIAIIAAGELSHALANNSSKKKPNGFGEAFDKLVIKSIENSHYDEIFQIDDNTILKAEECGLRPLVILLGAIQGYANQPQILSYESPLGVGHLTVDFKIR